MALHVYWISVQEYGADYLEVRYDEPLGRQGSRERNSMAVSPTRLH